jgi:hypothetical protein
MKKIVIDFPVIEGTEITITTPFVREGDKLRQTKSTHVWREGGLVFVSSYTSVLSAASSGKVIYANLKGEID